MSGSQKRIGLLLKEKESDFSIEVINAVSDACKKAGFPLFIFSIGELDVSEAPFDYHQMSLVKFVNSNNLDGVIICSAFLGNFTRHENLEEFVRSFLPLPIVSIGKKFPGIHSITVDPAPGITQILDDLVQSHYCKKFAILGNIPGSEEATLRTKIITDYFRKNNIRFDSRYILDGNFTYSTAYKALSKYYEESGRLDFDSIFALNDDMAFAAMDFCEKVGLRVPEDIHIAGFDDVVFAKGSRIPLTTVNQQIGEQARVAVECLMRLIEKKREKESIVVSTKPVFRKSCGCKNRMEKDDVAHDMRNEKSWLVIKPQFQWMNSFNAVAQVRQNINKFRKSFRHDVNQFDVSAAALVLYDTPIYVSEQRSNFSMPESATVLASFDDTVGFVQNINEPPIPFNPAIRLLPDNLIQWTPAEYNVAILSNCETQYGYVVYRAGSYETLIYSMMCTILSRLLWTAYENSKSEREQKIQAERTARLNLISKTDELTHLLNRRGFMELGQQTIDISVTLRQGGMVIFGDMDGLKAINDTYGHDAGDRAIQAEAEILKRSFRASDIIGRLGGDEFVIIAAGLGEPRLAEIRQNITAACKAWNIVHNEDFTLSISLGCQEFSAENKHLEDILKQADILLYEEKKRKKNARRSN